MSLYCLFLRFCVIIIASLAILCRIFVFVKKVAVNFYLRNNISRPPPQVGYQNGAFRWAKAALVNLPLCWLQSCRRGPLLSNIKNTGAGQTSQHFRLGQTAWNGRSEKVASEATRRKRRRQEFHSKLLCAFVVAWVLGTRFNFFIRIQMQKWWVHVAEFPVGLLNDKFCWFLNFHNF